VRLGTVVRGVLPEDAPLRARSDGRSWGAAVCGGVMRVAAPPAAGRVVGRASSAGRVVGRTPSEGLVVALSPSVGRVAGRASSVGLVVGRAPPVGVAVGRAPSVRRGVGRALSAGRADDRASPEGAASPDLELGCAVALPRSPARGGVRDTAGIAAGVAPEGRRTAVRAVEPRGFSLYSGPSR
jgi:hypothetical protein